MTKQQWNQAFRMNLRVARVRADISQIVLAQRLGVNSQQIHKWESGQVTPSGWAIQRLADALGCDITDLMPHSVAV